MSDQELLTKREAAKFFNVSMATVHRWLKSGKVPSVKIANTVRIPIEALRKVVAENAVIIADK